jgi:hypothetical protein
LLKPIRKKELILVTSQKIKRSKELLDKTSPSMADINRSKYPKNLSRYLCPFRYELAYIKIRVPIPEISKAKSNESPSSLKDKLIPKAGTHGVLSNSTLPVLIIPILSMKNKKITAGIKASTILLLFLTYFPKGIRRQAAINPSVTVKSIGSNFVKTLK